MKIKKQNIIISIFVLLLIICLIAIPDVSISACLNGLVVWATNILPALFPFFLFTKLLGEFGLITELSKYISPFTKKLYNTSGISGYIYIMSIMSGYPVGAKLTSDLYEKKCIDIGEAHRIVSFTSTSGPLFILGTVAIGMFGNKTLGYTILLSHFLGSLLNGILYRNYMIKQKSNLDTKITHTPSNNILEESMIGSIKSIMIVGGYISIFFMIITIVNTFNIYNPILFLLSKISPNTPIKPIISVLNGIIELTRGCLDLSLCNLPIQTTAIILSGIISFGGISINLQALTFLKKMKINLKFYFLQKFTHTILSMILAYIFGLIIL